MEGKLEDFSRSLFFHSKVPFRALCNRIPGNRMSLPHQIQGLQNISKGLQSRTTLGCQPKDGIHWAGGTPTQLQHQALAWEEASSGKGRGQVLHHQATVSLAAHGLPCNGLQGPSQLNPVWNLCLIFLRAGLNGILQGHKCKFPVTAAAIRACWEHPGSGHVSLS